MRWIVGFLLVVWLLSSAVDGFFADDGSTGYDDDDLSQIADYEAQLVEKRDAAVARLGWSEWDLVGQSCADGWQSPSIGRQGACSWHGGVVTTWENDAGGVIQCREGIPPDPLRAVEQLERLGTLVC